ncbi:preprotein translocase subunit SecE [Ruminococcus sp. NK3A76]|uniref:preprotein translocase subunit SecE n=1 Tax=Ruminococcus sp. NK3A76 TaxID=877411 RepID=UPI00048F6B90|nr:preprotein translocase subunit SecE [Ruminococcus sp. NK3A76]
MAKDTNAKKGNSKEVAAKKKKGGISKYFRDLKSELKKVVWPSRKQVVNNTGVVLVTMTTLGLFLAGIDLGLGKLLDLILKIGS